jgi:hypothetical protein
LNIVIKSRFKPVVLSILDIWPCTQQDGELQFPYGCDVVLNFCAQ